MSETTEQSDLGSTQGSERVRFDERLINLLKRNSDFVDDTGELLRDRIKHYAWQLDHDLINLLLTDKEIESKFFEEVSGRWIFNNNTFVDYINDKNFLDDSYTQFRNKIGLKIDDKFLRERGEVALVWPYKDCVLEGGQTHEEDNRDEIFFNELIAPDEINRMLAPKVLTNWKRYTVDGEQEVQNIQRDENGIIGENFVIKGSNLITLHTLKQEFRGQVRLIYIDPPYNTENDSFQYNDNFPRSTWLTFMKNRLEVAKELLRKDGFILIQIDNRELAYLKCLCDEVFDDNFRNGIIVKKGQKSLQRQFDSIDKLNAGYDTILFYSRDDNIKVPNLFKKLTGPSESSWNNHWRGTDRPTMRYELFGITPETGQWRWQQSRTYEAVENYRTLISYITSQGVAEEDITDAHIDTYYSSYMEENSILNHKDFELVRCNNRGSPEHYIPAADTILLSENWTDISVAGRQSDFSHEKNEEILKRILEWLTEEGDVVLDFFAGSGTTGVVAQKLNRQWIMVEQLDYIETYTVSRLNDVIAGEQGGVSESVNWQGGGDFIYCELMPYNQVFMDKLQRAQTTEDLLDIWREMSKESFLNWYVNPKKSEEAEDDFIAINNVDKQRKTLMDLLDKNQLYVHLSEIGDEKFCVSELDKSINEDFYGGDDDA